MIYTAHILSSASKDIWLLSLFHTQTQQSATFQLLNGVFTNCSRRSIPLMSFLNKTVRLKWRCFIFQSSIRKKTGENHVVPTSWQHSTLYNLILLIITSTNQPGYRVCILFRLIFFVAEEKKIEENERFSTRLIAAARSNERNEEHTEMEVIF